MFRMPPSLCAAILAACASIVSLASGATAELVVSANPSAPRERVRLRDGWRFHHDDPPGVTGLLYDVRPAVTSKQDSVPADAQPKAAEVVVATTQPVLKPWILPTANPFIVDPARRHPRPEGNPGGNVPYVQTNFDDSAWTPVSVPHDWAIAGPFIPTGDVGGMGRLPSWGIGWYRLKFVLSPTNAGKCLFLDIDGAMSYAAVWLNGHLVGGWPYGYSSWRLDLTPYAIPGGINQLAIRLDNPPSSSRWYPGGGLFRNVWLTTTAPIHVGQWGTVVRTPQVSTASAAIEVEVTVDNDSAADAVVSVATQLFALDADGRPSGEPVARIPSTDTKVAPHAHGVVKGAVTLAQPRLWGPPPTQQPNRYVAVTTLTQGGQVVDSYETRFGIRSLRFDPDSGLSVNGEHIALQGVNQHHDLGALGAAFNARAAERQLEILRDMGCNAIRTSHNPPAPELLEIADRLGFLVLDEAFDVWYRQKTPLDFHLIFPDWHEPDLRALLRRDRNHPSVVLWSIGNEVGEQYTAQEGAAVARELQDIVHQEDPTRPATCAMNYAKPAMALPATIDVIGLNYQGEGIRDTPEFEGTDRIRTPPQYDAFHQKYPPKPILSTETASAFSSRGVYLFPVTKETSAPVRDGRGGDSRIHQVSSYELHAVDFGSSADKVFASLAHHPFVAGEFVWSGWDYLGEPTPYYTARSSYCGIIDLAGFKKDRFYLYQSHWRPEFPMAHILPHWTWPERVGQVTPVHVFTSGDGAELFLNGRSLGRKAKGPYEYRLRWDEVVYEPGTLEVVAYKGGQTWAKDRVQTAGDAAALEAQPDRTTIRADGEDLSFVTVRIVDTEGRLAPRANQLIQLKVEGAGQLVATDNGDPTSFEPFPSSQRHAFNGLCLAIVRGLPGNPGPIKITATAAGLRPATAVITTR